MKFTLNFFFLFLVLSKSVYAADTLEELHRQPFRPTMQDVLPFLNQIKDEPGIPVAARVIPNYDKRIDIPTWLQRLLDSAPRLIAAAEALHPGATWVFLGRDSMAISDVFEAYYHTLGQKNRVVRLGVSKASFEHLDPKHLRDYLAQFFYDHGFNWNGQDGEYPPFILIDALSGGYGRQGRSILAAMYQQGLSEGEIMPTILERMNFLGLVVSTFQGAAYDVTQASVQQKREKWIWLLEDQNTEHQKLFDEKTIVTYASAIKGANESGYTHFIGAWHDSYGNFYRSRKGEIRTKLGAEFPLEMKKSILWTQKKIWEAVRAPQFRRQVEAEMREWKRNFEPTHKVLTSKERTDLKKLIDKVRRHQDYHQAYVDFGHLPHANHPAYREGLIRSLNQIKLTKDLYQHLAQTIAEPRTFATFDQFLASIAEDTSLQITKGSALDDLLKIKKALDKKSCDQFLSEAS